MDLKNLQFLILDLQATQTLPEKGFLFEAAWCSYRQSTRKKIHIQSRIIAPGDEAGVPKYILRLTGLSNEELLSGKSEKSVQTELWRAALETAAVNKLPVCPAVIHYASYENRYLEYLHKTYHKKEKFPFDVICTHRIASKLYSDLPRKGLRAVAGYLGYSVTEQKRAAEHAQATAFIWKKMIPELGRRFGITSYEALQNWLDEKIVKKKKKGRTYPFDITKIEGFPDSPGIYIMKRSNGDVLYVGKATSLKQRVRSYFHGGAKHSEHILEMLSQVYKIEHKRTGTSLDAAVEENRLIKKYNPPYNKALKSKDRTIAFYTKDLHKHRAGYNDTFCIGPIVHQTIIEQSRHLYECVKSNNIEAVTIQDLQLIMPFEGDLQPELSIFREGLALFSDIYKNKIDVQSFHFFIKSAGNILWLRYLEEREKKAAADAETDEQEEDAEEEEWEWTPERIMHHLEGIVSHTGHMLRRGKMYMLLKNCRLEWTGRDGKVKSLEMNKKRNNLALYDGLIVLLSEIRRIYSSGRFLKLIVYRNVRSRPIGPEVINRLLKWG
jgi:DNA polymerase-3 subunit epsilon